MHMTFPFITCNSIGAVSILEGRLYSTLVLNFTLQTLLLTIFEIRI